MACTITGTPEGDRALLAREAMEETRARAVSLTQMLCGLCRALEAGCDEDYLTEVPSLSDWWRKHKATDAKGEASR